MITKNRKTEDKSRLVTSKNFIDQSHIGKTIKETEVLLWKFKIVYMVTNYKQLSQILDIEYFGC